MIIKLSSAADSETQLAAFYKRGFYIHPPFFSLLIDFCGGLSERLFKKKNLPDFAALAFWMREGHIKSLKDRFYSKNINGNLYTPCGIVFHIPPAHIEAMFLYSWLTSLLAGNGNILRLPSEKTARFLSLMETIEELLKEERFREIRERTAFVEYGHEEAITEFLSATCAVRIIWGGDETINRIRKIPLNPRARELVFPDRFSLATVHAGRYSELSEEEKDRLAGNFFQDLYNFDQAACSSPRLIFWVGRQEEIEPASDWFYGLLQEKIEAKDYQVSLGGALLKQTYAYNQALDLPVEEVRQISNELTILKITTPSEACRLHPGQGLLYHVEINELAAMRDFISQHDQTLAYYGFPYTDLKGLVDKLNGKGLTRIVPIGQALHFETTWDGHNLFAQLTQEITLS